MLILGLEPIVAALLFTSVGAGLQLGLGYAASNTAFDVKKAISTAVISGILGITVLTAALGSISENATDLEVLAIVSGAIVTIAGIDTLKNHIIKAAKTKKA